MKAKQRASSAIMVAFASSSSSSSSSVHCFAPPPIVTPRGGGVSPSSSTPRRTTRGGTTGYGGSSTGTSLDAIGVFVRKAKEADVRRYCEGGPPESVLSLLRRISDAAADAAEKTDDPDAAPPPRREVGTLQSLLTKRRGTISVIAEYKRLLPGSGFLADAPAPELLSPVFREFGASAVAVLADERSGGCTYEDIVTVVREQGGAADEVPGPLPVISSDLVVDEVQVARAKDAGAVAVSITIGLVGTGGTRRLVNAARALDMESIVVVSTSEEAASAVSECGASIVCVSGGVDGAESKRDVASSLLGPAAAATPDGRPVCVIASVLARGNKALEEVEEAWTLRDYGFHSVWVSDALYKSGSDPVEHPGAIIASMRLKSSVKYASPKARSGKGEGAREYLGDIMM